MTFVILVGKLSRHSCFFVKSGQGPRVQCFTSVALNFLSEKMKNFHLTKKLKKFIIIV